MAYGFDLKHKHVFAQLESGYGELNTDDVLSRHGGCEPMRVIEGILGTADGF